MSAAKNPREPSKRPPLTEPSSGSGWDATLNLLARFQRFLRDIGGILLLALSTMTLLALLHAWPRRTGWWTLAFWVVLVLAFNLAGLLTYLALNHTPVIRCSTCGRRRGLLRPDCPACRSPLPVPQSRSTDLIIPAM